MAGKQIDLPKYRKQDPGRIFFKGPFVGGGGGLIYGGKIASQNSLGFYLEGNLRLKIDWASL